MARAYVRAVSLDGVDTESLGQRRQLGSRVMLRVPYGIQVELESAHRAKNGDVAKAESRVVRDDGDSAPRRGDRLGDM